jgi:hypothetical protein
MNYRNIVPSDLCRLGIICDRSRRKLPGIFHEQELIGSIEIREFLEFPKILLDLKRLTSSYTRLAKAAVLTLNSFR